MAFSIGIVGLPNAGKSTLFGALTKREILIAPYPFSTVDPNIGIIFVPDKNLEKISQIANFSKITPTTIKFVDLAGLVKDAHKGEGLGNQFLAHIRECDGIVEVIRCFENKEVEGYLPPPQPQKDILILEKELIMKDLETVQKILAGLKPKLGIQEKTLIKKKEILEKIKECLGFGKKINEISLDDYQKDLIKEYQFLTQKPIIYLFNVSNKKEIKIENYQPSLCLDLKYEYEISKLTPEEIKEIEEESKLDQLIIACYNSLNLITFYTIAGLKEAKAWTLKRGQSILEAGKKVHSDFKEKFIKAEVVSLDNLLETGSWQKAKEKGKIKIVGKDYIVQDKDIIEFKI